MEKKPISIDDLLQDFRNNPPKPCNVCPSDDEIFDFVYDMLSPEQAMALEEHVKNCRYTKYQVMKHRNTRQLMVDEISAADPYQIIADKMGIRGLLRLTIMQIPSLWKRLIVFLKKLLSLKEM